MLFNKKSLMSFLSLMIAVPAQAGPTGSKTITTKTTSTTQGSSKATISVTLPFSKTTGYEILGSAGAALGLLACWKIYKVLGGTKSFQQFMTDANTVAQKAVSLQDATYKTSLGKRYTGMTDDQKNAIIDQAYESYVTDQSAKLLGVNGDAFKNYVDSLNGTTFVDRLTTARAVVDTLSADPRSAIPGALNNEPLFKSALRYAIDNNITDQGTAGTKAASFPKTVEVNPATGEGPSGEIGSGIGRAVDNVIIGAGDMASNAAVRGQQAFNSMAQGLNEQAGYAASAFKNQQAMRQVAENVQNTQNARATGNAQAAQAQKTNVNSENPKVTDENNGVDQYESDIVG